jgi:hypothetical protein
MSANAAFGIFGNARIAATSSRRPFISKREQSGHSSLSSDNPNDRLLAGQVKAVHAAFKAGIAPPRIAREFGISQSEVRKDDRGWGGVAGASSSTPAVSEREAL